MVLILSSSFPETLFNSWPHILLELGSTRILTNFRQRNYFEAIKQIVNGLHEEMKEELPAKGPVLQNYFNLLLIKIYRLSLEQSEKVVTADSRNTHNLRNFQRSIKQSYTHIKSINEYARELNITPVHLNCICQSTVGKSAWQIVHDFLILEAEKYLKFTEYSISEIAYRLNFEDRLIFHVFSENMQGHHQNSSGKENKTLLLLPVKFSF